MKEPIEFQVRRDNIGETAFVPKPSRPLAKDQVRLAVEAFALTANNVTYGVFGDAMQYWSFFPAREGWGIIPVWGFATVEESENAAITKGERIYGYLPMASHFVVTAANVTPQSFGDVTSHRQGLPFFYNQYTRVAGDAGFDPAHDAEQMLFRPLFTTGFLIDDFLADSNFFGARTVLVSSASSKTSIGLAHCLAKRGRDACEVVGLTSRKNVAFVEGIGSYHRVVAYEDILSIAKDTPVVFVDMAGDAGLTSSVHSHFGDSLKYSCAVGASHWQSLAFGQQFPGPQPILFFAPSRAEQRLADWGAAGFQQRMGEAWAAFVPTVKGWMRIERADGEAAIERVYRATLDGSADPRCGYILSF